MRDWAIWQGALSSNDTKTLYSCFSKPESALSKLCMTKSKTIFALSLDMCHKGIRALCCIGTLLTFENFVCSCMGVLDVPLQVSGSSVPAATMHLLLKVTLGPTLNTSMRRLGTSPVTYVVMLVWRRVT